MIDVPFQPNKWQINKFLTVVLSVQLTMLGLVGLGDLGLGDLGLDIPVLRQIVGFIYLAFLSGVVILCILKLHRLGKDSMVYVSNFSEWANLPKLIQATRLVKTNYPDIKLVLVGAGPSVSRSKELVRSLKLSEHVEFLGRIEREGVVCIVNRCEIALSTCKKDLYRDSAFPLKLMEYTALGKKIVSSNLEEVKLLGFSNITFYDESKGAEELADAIVTAFNTDIDQHEIRKLTYKHRWIDVAEQFHSIIGNVLAQDEN